jgi:hypothetical protein
MAASSRSKKPKARPDDFARGIGAMIEGLSINKILKADERELVIELSDGTRLLVHTDDKLDISVT